MRTALRAVRMSHLECQRQRLEQKSFLTFEHLLNMMLKHVVGAGDDDLRPVDGVHSE